MERASFLHASKKSKAERGESIFTLRLVFVSYFRSARPLQSAAFEFVFDFRSEGQAVGGCGRR